ncbi:MAG: NCS2 family permease [Thermoplasmata archaeon]|nr:NCS2 family permease [Thermoplasmata archaeon]
MSELSTKIDDFFHISERGSDIRTEIRGGIITFLAMLYILAVNPSILSSTTGIDFQDLVGATALAACVSCLLMGLYARFPLALAPGMGINAFVAFTIVGAMGFDYYSALMAVFISGVLFLILTVTGIRHKIMDGIPLIIKLAISGGIGFFIVMVGLFNAGIIVHGEGSALTLGELGSPGVLLGLFCILTTLALWYRNHWSAVLIGAILTVIVGFIGGQLFGWDTTVNGMSLIPGVGTATVDAIVTTPNFGLFGDVFTHFELFDIKMWPAFIVSVISLLVVDVFDTTGTLVAAGNAAGVIDDEGNVEGNEKVFMTDSLATVFGAVAGTSTTTSFVESTTGITAGARTGLMAVVVGIMFFLALFFTPVFSIVTSACTVGALVIVGFMMIRTVKDINWMNPISLATAFTTIFMMGLAGSITDGIALGSMVYLWGMVLTGKKSEIPTVMKVIGVVFLVYFVLTYTVIPNI